MKLSDQELQKWVRLVVQEFYDLVYDDEWFSKIFRNIEKEIIVNQQTDFMVQSFGGPKVFYGRVPKDAHPQIWIDEDIWAYREYLLREAFKTINPPKDFQEKWLKIDEAFKGVIINKLGPEECVGRYKTDEIIYEPMPLYLKKKAS